MLNWIVKKIYYVIGCIQGMYAAINLKIRHPRMSDKELVYEAFHEGLIDADDVQEKFNKAGSMRS